MRVLFDLSATQPRLGKFHGGSEYAKAVFRQLLLLRKDEVVLSFYDPQRWFDPVLEGAVREAGITLFAVSTKRDIQALLGKGICDRVYLPLPYRYYDVDFSKVDLIFTIHGLRSIEMPADKYEVIYEPSLLRILKYIYKSINRQRYINSKKRRFAKLLRTRARRKTIVVDTYHTRYALLGNFPDLRHEQIRVIYAPTKRVSIPNESEVGAGILEKFNVSARGYFLLISGNRWIKNVFRAIRALDEAFSSYPDIAQKVLTLGVDNPTLFRRYIKNKDRFAFFGYVDEVELELLYKGAYSFIYPTLNEGFGLPLLESMQYGTPVICSAITTTTEVCGDAVLYFNPLSVEEIKNRILWMLFEDGTWEEYSHRAKERSRFIAAKQDRMLGELCRLILAP